MERKDCKRNAPDRIDITMYDGTNMSIPCKYANSTLVSKSAHITDFSHKLRT